MRIVAALLVALIAQIGCPAAAAAPDRDQVNAVMQLALQAGEREANATAVDPLLSFDDRRYALGQFAMMLVVSGQCDGAVQFVDHHAEIMAAGIERLILRLQSDRESRCILRLANIMATRWQDHDLSPTGQVAMRFIAAAYLDANGDLGARSIRDTVEANLLSQSNTDILWQARVSAVNAYHGKPGYMHYLDYLADRMIKENQSSSLEGQSLLIRFAGEGRCDLVQRVFENVSKNCDSLLQRYNSIQNDPIGTNILESFTTDVRLSISEESVHDALLARSPYSRLTRLLLLVDECTEALSME